MGRISFAVENKKSAASFDYPKMKLEKGESARVAILEEPWMEYVHTLRKPVLLNGVPQMETKQNRKGEDYQTYKLEFVSKPLCTGDQGILDDKGSDPEHCVMCAAAKENPDITSAPQRRYAVHAVRYKLKGGNVNTLMDPYSVDIEVWSFTDRIMGILIDANETWGEDGGLKEHDLFLGPCENANFQKFDINVAPKAFYRKNKETAQHTIEALKSGQLDDISIACGSKKEERWITQDVKDIQDAWREVYSYEKRNNGIEDEADATASISDDISSILDDADDVAESKPAKEAPAEETSADEDEDAMDINSLLEGLD